MSAVAIEEAPDGAVVIEPTLTPGESRHLKALEKRIETGLNTFRSVGEALLDIRDNRLFRMTHNSFETYCRDRWGLERARAYQLMGAAEVVQALPEGTGPTNEAQARELLPVLHTDPALMQRVWERVTSSDEPVTAPRIREAVREVTGSTVTAPSASPTLTDRLVTELTRAGATYRLWAAQNPTTAEKRDVSRALDNLTALAR